MALIIYTSYEFVFPGSELAGERGQTANWWVSQGAEGSRGRWSLPCCIVSPRFSSILHLGLTQLPLTTPRPVGGYRGGSPTAVQAWQPCGSRPLVTPYYCRLGDLLCFVFMFAFCVFDFSVYYLFLQYFDTVGWVF